MELIKENKSKYIGIVLIDFILLALSYNAVYKINPIFWTVLIIGIVILDTFLVRQKFELEGIKRFITKKNITLWIIRLAVLMLLSVLLNVAITKVTNGAFISYSRILMVFFVGLIILVGYSVKTLENYKEEAFFVFVGVICSLYFVVVSPRILGISWDDQYHYDHALSLVYLTDNTRYEADNSIENYSVKYVPDEKHSPEKLREYYKELNNSYKSKEVVPDGKHKYSYDIHSYAYIPYALGIFIGRGLGLSYTKVFMLGRFVNALFYIIVIAIGINKLKYGKTLLGVLGLNPMSVFLACSYSYDSWGIAFIFLGYAYYISSLQAEETISFKKQLLMIIFIAIGCFPKQIYFTLLLPLLFVSKKRFKSIKEWKRFLAMDFVAGVLLFISFVIPFFIHTETYNDPNGGAGVDAIAQIGFILHNPIAYAKIVITFLRGYLNLDNSWWFIQDIGYLNAGKYFATVLALYFVVAFLDRNPEIRISVRDRIVVFISIAITIMLIVTAIYVSFNPVGSSVINGCQFRYLIPFLLPLFFFGASDKGVYTGNRNLMSIVSYSMIAIIFILLIYQICGIFW